MLERSLIIKHGLSLPIPDPQMLPLIPQHPCTPGNFIMPKDFTPSRPVLDNLPCPRQALSGEDAETDRTARLSLSIVGEMSSQRRCSDG